LIVTNRYDPVAEIGVGGMGAVVLARALSGPSAGNHVAMKRLLPHLAQEPEVLKAFLDEVYVISAMHHPHIVESIDWGKDQDGRFLVMQFVPGDSLRALVHAREQLQQHLPIEVVAEIGACAALGLHAAHTVQADGTLLGIVHQDISPANILVGYDGTVKVIDFGVARIMSRKEEQDSQSIRGKFGYMSPEQLRGLPLDHRSDLFSLGVVLWETLTLCRLYSAKDEFDVARMVVSEDPVAPSSIRSEIPPELDQIVLRCLAKDRNVRFNDARELARALAPLRPARDRAPQIVGELARSSMPQRLEWIENVLKRPVGFVPRAPIASDEMLNAAPLTASPSPSYHPVSPEDLNDTTDDGVTGANDTQSGLDPTPSMPMATIPGAAAIQPQMQSAPFAAPTSAMQSQAQGSSQSYNASPIQATPYASSSITGQQSGVGSTAPSSSSAIAIRVAALVVIAVVALLLGHCIGSR
jgi:serine/threonine-protein kinase